MIYNEFDSKLFKRQIFLRIQTKKKINIIL